MTRTEAQIAASRRNGANSRGPATAAGKTRSAVNAIKHGLWSTQVVLATEDPQAWAEFKQRLADSLKPTTPAARELVEELAAARWRLDRVVSIETALLNTEIERFEKEYETNPDAGPSPDGFALGAAAWRSLHDNGILRHVHRQEARLRRIYDQLLQQWSEVEQEQQCDNREPQRADAPQMCRNEPGTISAPTPKRPTYDQNGRRIHYPDQRQAA